MGLVHKFLVERVVAEARVDVVIIPAGVTVIGLLRLVVQQERRVPDSRRTQVGDIVQMVDKSLDITTVPGYRILPVHDVRRLGHGPRNGRAVLISLPVPGPVVTGTGRSKPVGHDEINQVGRRETRPLGTPLLPLADQIGILDFLLSVVHHQVVRSGLGIGLDLDVDEQIIRTGGLMEGLCNNPFPAFDADFLAADAGSLHHQLQRSLHSGPPAQRFHARHLLPGCIGNLRRVESRMAASQPGSHGRRHHHFPDFIHPSEKPILSIRYIVPEQGWP